MNMLRRVSSEKDFFLFFFWENSNVLVFSLSVLVVVLSEVLALPYISI